MQIGHGDITYIVDIISRLKNTQAKIVRDWFLFLHDVHVKAPWCLHVHRRRAAAAYMRAPQSSMAATRV